jgi:spore protease
MRTDLAHESNPKPSGNYVTLFCEEFDTPQDIAALTDALHKVLPPGFDAADKKTLIVGLGNANITPDSLGVRAASKVLATGHFCANPELQEEFDELGMRNVCVVTPGVMAQTGFETADGLRYIADGIRPDCIIVIDSLACSSVERLAKTIQLTDTGISPGSGVANNRREISAQVFGIPVIATGVPTVIDWLHGQKPTRDVHTPGHDESPLMVVPRNIDVIINHYARVISSAINRVLNPGLNESEIEGLLMHS